MTKNNKNKGIALTMVIVLSSMFLLLGATVLISVGSHYRLNKHLIDSARAFYLTEAGIHWAIYRIRTVEDPSYNSLNGDNPWPFQGTDIDIIIDASAVPATADYTVTTTTDSATSPGNVVRTIQVVVNRPPPFTPPVPVTIESWQELQW